ncbi:MAG: GGDEF domain-containing protein [Campylobacterota bacterium]|nr:GGDEF domain-containing protein [Campylobacterota bacterium]
MTVHDIIKKSIERLRSEGKLLTPDFYAEAFCIEAKKAGMLTDDCNQVDKYASSLDSSYQNEIKQYRVKTTQELIRFLISKINRMNPTECANLLESNSALLKRVLQSVEVLHNSNAATLSKKTLMALKKQNNPETLDELRKKWMDFLTVYDNTILKKLSSYTTVYPEDLNKTLNGLGKKVGEGVELQGMDKVATLLIASLAPSIASGVNDELADVSDSLRINSSLLTSQSMYEEIKEAIKLRITLDKASVKDMMMTLDEVLDKLSLQLIDLIEKSDSSSIELSKIKKDLEHFDEDKKIDFKSAHKKLLTIALTLEEKTSHLSQDLKVHNRKVGALSDKVAHLEAELLAAQRASREDFLTKLYNKRAIDEQLKIKEGEYERYGRNYSIVMFDLDFFKAVNDTYGHDAGDAVLAAFAKILKKLCRTVDVVGRYGGEEFVAILSDTGLDGALKFGNKVRSTLEHTKLMYKKQHIKVTASGGAAERKAFQSIKATMQSADERLYDAKNSGRNCIEPTLVK